MHGMGQDLAEICPTARICFFHVCGMTFLWITAMYLSEFNIPSTETIDPKPQKRKQPQIIYFGECFTTWLKW